MEPMLLISKMRRVTSNHTYFHEIVHRKDIQDHFEQGGVCLLSDLILPDSVNPNV